MDLLHCFNIYIIYNYISTTRSVNQLLSFLLLLWLFDVNLIPLFTKMLKNTTCTCLSSCLRTSVRTEAAVASLETETRTKAAPDLKTHKQVRMSTTCDNAASSRMNSGILLKLHLKFGLNTNFNKLLKKNCSIPFSKNTTCDYFLSDCISNVNTQTSSVT